MHGPLLSWNLLLAHAVHADAPVLAPKKPAWHPTHGVAGSDENLPLPHVWAASEPSAQNVPFEQSVHATLPLWALDFPA